MKSAAGAANPPDVPGIGRRLLSMLYESLLVLAIAFFAAFAFHGAALERLSGATRHIFQLYLLLILGIYFVACWTRKGSTLPMQTWKIRLVNADGGRLPVGRAMLRYALAWPSLMFCGVGVLWALVDRDRQFLHDRLAGTKIVNSDPLSDGPS
jgi:uncharacterized RDD family membrane protein YckC